MKILMEVDCYLAIFYTDQLVKNVQLYPVIFQNIFFYLTRFLKNEWEISKVTTFHLAIHYTHILKWADWFFSLEIVFPLQKKNQNYLNFVLNSLRKWTLELFQFTLSNIISFRHKKSISSVWLTKIHHSAPLSHFEYRIRD